MCLVNIIKNDYNVMHFTWAVYILFYWDLAERFVQGES